VTWISSHLQQPLVVASRRRFYETWDHIIRGYVQFISLNRSSNEAVDDRTNL